MKKITLSLIILAATITSCKKDRVCTCTYQDGSVASEVTYTKVTKKDAKAACVSASPNITCSVK